LISLEKEIHADSRTNFQSKLACLLLADDGFYMVRDVQISYPPGHEGSRFVKEGALALAG
jgi:hypothetical protein